MMFPIYKCGLVVNLAISFLGASPDGGIYNSGQTSCGFDAPGIRLYIIKDLLLLR